MQEDAELGIDSHQRQRSEGDETPIATSAGSYPVGGPGASWDPTGREGDWGSSQPVSGGIFAAVGHGGLRILHPGRYDQWETDVHYGDAPASP